MLHMYPCSSPTGRKSDDKQNCLPASCVIIYMTYVEVASDAGSSEICRLVGGVTSLRQVVLCRDVSHTNRMSTLWQQCYRNVRVANASLIQSGDIGILPSLLRDRRQCWMFAASNFHLYTNAQMLLSPVYFCSIAFNITPQRLLTSKAPNSQRSITHISEVQNK